MWDGVGWLLQWIASNLAWTLVVIVAVAIFTYVRKKYPMWATAILYGLACGALIGGILLMAAAWRASPQRTSPVITLDNVESNVRKWADDFGLSVARIQDPPSGVDWYFGLALTLKNGQTVIVSRQKHLDRYLVLDGAVAVSPEHKVILQGFNQDQMTELSDDLNFEMAQAKIGFTVGLPNLITVERRLPITQDLTETQFVDAVDDVDFGLILARETVRLRIGDLATRQSKVPSNGARTPSRPPQ